MATTVGFLGGGNMAEALLRGLLDKGWTGSSLWVTDPRQDRLEELRQRWQVTTVESNSQLVERCDTVVLAVKPQQAQEVLPPIADVFTPDKRLLSVLAGVATKTLEGYLHNKPRVVRAMPNTPSLVGAGAAALCPGRYATPEDLQVAESILGAVGIVRRVKEAQMDAVTGVSGSGPAYIYSIIESLTLGGVAEGLDRQDALALATQTVLGAGRMVQETGESPAVLRDRVCSPAGTTVNGVKALEERGLRYTMMSAVEVAAARSRELGG